VSVLASKFQITAEKGPRIVFSKNSGSIKNAEFYAELSIVLEKFTQKEL
jgi:hypothetical protein